MTDLIVKPKNKMEEKIILSFLNSINIGYYTEDQEEQALYAAMAEGKRTPRLTLKEKDAFLRMLKGAR